MFLIGSGRTIEPWKDSATTSPNLDQGPRNPRAKEVRFVAARGAICVIRRVVAIRRVFVRRCVIELRPVNSGIVVRIGRCENRGAETLRARLSGQLLRQEVFMEDVVPLGLVHLFPTKR
jgi:hypothetical protein